MSGDDRDGDSAHNGPPDSASPDTSSTSNGGGESDANSDEPVIRSEQRKEFYGNTNVYELESTRELADGGWSGSAANVLTRLSSIIAPVIIISFLLGPLLFIGLDFDSLAPTGDINVSAGFDNPPPFLNESNSTGSTVKAVTSGGVFTVAANNSTSHHAPSFARLPGGLTTTPTVNPDRYGLEDTPANRSCLQKTRQVGVAFLRNSSQGESITLGTTSVINASTTTVNGVTVTHTPLVRGGTPASELLLKYGLADMREEIDGQALNQYTTIQRQAFENNNGVWGCPQFSVQGPTWQQAVETLNLPTNTTVTDDTDNSTTPLLRTP